MYLTVVGYQVDLRCELNGLLDKLAGLDIVHLECTLLHLRIVGHNDVARASRDEVLNGALNGRVDLLGIVGRRLDNALNHRQSACCTSLELLLRKKNTTGFGQEGHSLGQAHGVTPDLRVRASLIESECARGFGCALGDVWLPTETSSLEVTAHLLGEEGLRKVADIRVNVQVLLEVSIS